MIDQYTVAARLYSTYCNSVGGLAFNGDPLPKWADFYNDATKQKQVNAWMDTAQAAIELLLS
jgi:hypothetical protein